MSGMDEVLIRLRDTLEMLSGRCYATLMQMKGSVGVGLGIGKMGIAGSGRLINSAMVGGGSGRSEGSQSFSASHSLSSHTVTAALTAWRKVQSIISKGFEAFYCPQDQVILLQKAIKSVSTTQHMFPALFSGLQRIANSKESYNRRIDSRISESHDDEGELDIFGIVSGKIEILEANTQDLSFDTDSMEVTVVDILAFLEYVRCTSLTDVVTMVAGLHTFDNESHSTETSKDCYEGVRNDMRLSLFGILRSLLIPLLPRLFRTVLKSSNLPSIVSYDYGCLIQSPFSQFFPSPLYFIPLSFIHL